MFNSTRIKLTGWYSLIILVLSGTLSIVLYFRTNTVIDQQYFALENRLRQDAVGWMPRGMNPVQVLNITEEERDRAKREIAVQLIIVNTAILGVFSFAGYFLSGKTLEPIRRSMDKQKRFIGDASHELKTPITALRTSLEVNLMDNSLHKDAKDILEENLTDVKSLQSLTENLLELALLDENGTANSMAKVSLLNVLDQAVNQVSELAKKKQIKILLNLAGLSDKDKITAHQESITRLFIIFLENAIKYSHENTQIDITAKKDRKNFQVEITDHGIGIAKHHLPHIFERFYRVDESRHKSDRNGYGLGLSVANKIIEQHQGKIEVESELDKGTTFTIYLPIIS